jgi:hypothetical protein
MKTTRKGRIVHKRRRKISHHHRREGKNIDDKTFLIIFSISILEPNIIKLINDKNISGEFKENMWKKVFSDNFYKKKCNTLDFTL